MLIIGRRSRSDGLLVVLQMRVFLYDDTNGYVYYGFSLCAFVCGYRISINSILAPSCSACAIASSLMLSGIRAAPTNR
jgi:hypothetical protein